MVPSLRERKEDIPYLAKRFLDIANIELKKEVRGFSGSALNVLFTYNWPGNVRQLRSTIRRAALLADDMITEKHLDLKRVAVSGLTSAPRVKVYATQGPRAPIPFSEAHHAPLYTSRSLHHRPDIRRSDRD